ncbi:hypothetical protein [Halorussus sp. AFM4]|uniref:hypothetical protein n=1 Tax=Halorussus sp. AFM4 TaxID=3421651 RepID=UPI003EBBF435
MTDSVSISKNGREVRVEVTERPYKQYMDAPVVEVTRWHSLTNSQTLVFVETDVAHQQLESAGTLLGTLPTDVVEALAEHGYDVVSDCA